MNKFIFLTLIFFISSCGESFKDSESSLVSVNNQNTGATKKFISKNILSGIFSQENYHIQARLVEKDSFIELFSHFTDFDLEDGLKVRFEKQEVKLIVKISVQGWPEKVLFEKENYFLNQKEIDFKIEVHNGVDYGFRVQLWESFVNKTGLVKENSAVLTGENLIADSFAKKMSFYGKGRGLKWGIKLFHSHLIKGNRISPRIL